MTKKIKNKTKYLENNKKEKSYLKKKVKKKKVRKWKERNIIKKIE